MQPPTTVQPLPSALTEDLMLEVQLESVLDIRTFSSGALEVLINGRIFHPLKTAGRMLLFLLRTVIPITFTPNTFLLMILVLETTRSDYVVKYVLAKTTSLLIFIANR